MRVNILCDASWAAKIDKILDALSDTNYRHFFEAKNYGSSIEGVVIFLMCLPSEYNLKQRIRFYKKEKTLYLDLMLDLALFKQIGQEEKNKIVAVKMINEVPQIIKKYKFKDFDLMKFEDDLKKLLKKLSA